MYVVLPNHEYPLQCTCTVYNINNSIEKWVSNREPFRWESRQPLTTFSLPAPVFEMLLERLINSDACSAPRTATTPYEVTRAQEVNGLLGPKGSEKAVDLICDLHNTTANMGLCILAHVSDWVGLHLFKYLQVSAAPYALIQLKGPLSHLQLFMHLK